MLRLRATILDIEQECDDIAVLDDVALPFGVEQPPFSALGYAAAFHQVLIANYLSPDEAPLHI